MNEGFSRNHGYPIRPEIGLLELLVTKAILVRSRRDPKTVLLCE